MIRRAEKEDLSRIGEILVFVKRIKFRPIFQDDDFSFNELQVLKVAKEYENHLPGIWVYDDGIVKGLIHIEDEEVKELYVDYFFQDQGIGSKLLEYAIDNFDVKFLWALEKNPEAIRFYERHSFRLNGQRRFEEGTPEYLVMLVRN